MFRFFLESRLHLPDERDVSTMKLCLLGGLVISLQRWSDRFYDETTVVTAFLRWRWPGAFYDEAKVADVRIDQATISHDLDLRCQKIARFKESILLAFSHHPHSDCVYGFELYRDGWLSEFMIMTY